MATVNLIQSLSPGFKLGSSVRGRLDEGKQAALGAQQREILGGLRRRSLGLGGATSGQQQEARLELLSADPVAAGKFFDSFSKLPTPEQDRIKVQMGRMATAADNIVGLPDEQLGMGLAQTRQAFINSGDQQAAQRVDALIKENLEPQQLRLRLSAISAQTRDQEKVIASREKAALNQAKQSQTDLNDKLKKDKTAFDQTTTLRKDVTAISKEFVKVRDARNRLEAVFDTNKIAKVAADFARAAKNNPKAEQIAQSTEAFGDMALIFNFMKMLDPGSTVREGEFASAQNTGGVDDKIINLYNQAIKGTRLNDSQRSGLRAQATGLFKIANEQHKKDLLRFRKSAKAFGLDEAQIFDVEEVAETPSALAPVQQLEGFGDLSPEDQAELKRLGG